MAYTEIRDLGTRGKLGRYAMHFHKLGAASAGFKLTGLSIWSSVSDPVDKFIAVHGSSRTEIRNVVGYNCQGRCFYLEDATEVGNILENNLGVLSHGPEELQAGQGPLGAVFWLREGNTVRNNVAAGSTDNSSGFWISPSKVTANLPPTIFEGNVAHTNDVGISYVTEGRGDMALTNFTQGHIWRNVVGIISDSSSLQATTSNSIFLGNGDQPADDSAYGNFNVGNFVDNLYFTDTVPPQPVVISECVPNVCTPQCPQYCGNDAQCNGVCDIGANGISEDGIFCPADCGGGGGWESSCGNSSCDAGDSWVCPNECAGVTGRAELVPAYITWRPNPDPSGTYCNDQGQCQQNAFLFVNVAYQNVGNQTSGTACVRFGYSSDGQNWNFQGGWDKDREQGVDGGYGIEYVEPGAFWGRGLDTAYSQAVGGLAQLALSSGGIFIRMIVDECDNGLPDHQHLNGTTPGDDKNNNIFTVFIP